MTKKLKMPVARYKAYDQNEYRISYKADKQLHHRIVSSRHECDIYKSKQIHNM